MIKDCNFHLVQLQVDGGMTASSLLLQLQADLVGLDVSRPKMAESSALVLISYLFSYKKMMYGKKIQLNCFESRELQWLLDVPWANGTFLTTSPLETTSIRRKFPKKNETNDTNSGKGPLNGHLVGMFKVFAELAITRLEQSFTDSGKYLFFKYNLIDLFVMRESQLSVINSIS